MHLERYLGLEWVLRLWFVHSQDSLEENLRKIHHAKRHQTASTGRVIAAGNGGEMVPRQRLRTPPTPKKLPVQCQPGSSNQCRKSILEGKQKCS